MCLLSRLSVLAGLLLGYSPCPAEEVVGPSGVTFKLKQKDLAPGPRRHRLLPGRRLQPGRQDGPHRLPGAERTFLSPAREGEAPAEPLRPGSAGASPSRATLAPGLFTRPSSPRRARSAPPP